MAVRHDVSATATATNANSISVSIAVASHPNRLLVATLFQWDPTSTAVPTSVTFNTSETLDNEVNQTFDLARLTINALASPSATTANVTATLSGTVARLILHVSSFYGVDQTSPVGSALSRSGVTNSVGDLGVDGGDTDGGIIYCAAAQDLDASASPSVTPKNGMPYFAGSGSLSTATTQTVTNARTAARPLARRLGACALRK